MALGDHDSAPDFGRRRHRYWRGCHRNLGRSPAYIQTVTRSWLLRSKAAVLVAVILSGGGGMPILDVALSHGLASAYAAQPHFEPSGTTCSHGEICRLGSKLPFSANTPALDLDISVAVLYFPKVALPVTAPRSTDLGLLPQPRAPPSLSA